MKIFNINDYVKVKLTDEGLKILEEQHNELLKKMTPDAAADLGSFVAPEVDEEGYSQIQLYELMYHFGKYMRMSNSKIPFEMDIQIADEDLIEYEKTNSR